MPYAILTSPPILYIHINQANNTECPVGFFSPPIPENLSFIMLFPSFTLPLNSIHLLNHHCPPYQRTLNKLNSPHTPHNPYPTETVFIQFNHLTPPPTRAPNSIPLHLFIYNMTKDYIIYNSREKGEYAQQLKDERNNTSNWVCIVVSVKYSPNFLVINMIRYLKYCNLRYTPLSS